MLSTSIWYYQCCACDNFLWLLTLPQRAGAGCIPDCWHAAMLRALCSAVLVASLVSGLPLPDNTLPVDTLDTSLENIINVDEKPDKLVKDIMDGLPQILFNNFVPRWSWTWARCHSAASSLWTTSSQTGGSWRLATGRGLVWWNVAMLIMASV